jgi:hypothetical protein
MTVHVDELTSDVVVETEAAGAEEPGATERPASRWEEEDRFRALRERLARDLLRTSSEGFND